MSDPNQQNNNGGAAWYGEIPAESAELRTWVESKQFANPLAALTSYHNAEKLLGAPADQILRLPKPEDAEGQAKLWDRLGRPAKPEEYEIPLPEGDDGALAKAMAGVFHKAGVPKGMAKSIAEGWNAHISELQKAEKAAADEREAQSVAAVAALEKEYGEKWTATQELAKRGIAAVMKDAGLDAEGVGKLESVLGTAGLVKLAARFGALAQEGGLGGGGEGGAFNGTVSQAKLQLEALQQKRIKGEVSDATYWEQRKALDAVIERAA